MQIRNFSKVYHFIKLCKKEEWDSDFYVCTDSYW